MFQMPDKTNEQNENKNEKIKESNHIPNSSNSKIIMNNSPNNSIIDNENMIHLINNQDLSKINKEMENIALTGQTKISWEELKPYIIYFYEKNVKNFSEKQKNSADLNILHNGELPFPFHNKKESKDDQMDLNNSNEHNIIEDKHLNLIDDFHLSEENHLIDGGININEENKIYKSDKDENIEKDIIDFINKMNLMPFTIQRIAELLLEPNKYYSTLLKYNRAFYKLVNIDFD
jgi:hypothetical protein